MKLSFPLLLAGVFVLILSINTRAQQPNLSFTLKGKIVDESSGSALEFATIALKKLRDSSLVSGTISNVTGDFILESLPPGGYNAEIAFIGYEKQNIKVFFKPQTSGPVNDLGIIKLKLSAKMLEGAEIVADKSFMMNNIDRKTYNADQLAVATGGNVTDILQTLPSVEIDADGNISLRGNENVTILIDGRPSGLTGSGGKSLLESLPASAIEKIEIITNPSAKFDPDGISGIINIITKKNKLIGLTGSITATTNFNKGYGGSGSLNYRKGKFNVYSLVSYNYNKRFSSNESLRSTYLLPGEISYLDQDGEGNSNNRSFNIKAGTDYTLTDKSTLSFSAMLNQSAHDADEFLWYRFYGIPFVGDSMYRRNTSGNDSENEADLELAFRNYFKSPGRLLTIQANASYSSEDENDKYKEQSYLNESLPDLTQLPLLQNDNLNETNTIYTFSADYENPLSETKKIEVGLKSTLRTIDNDFSSEYFNDSTLNFVNDTMLTNRFVYDDGVHAVYLQYRQSMGKFGIQAGLRSEYAQRESELKNTGEKFNKDYF